MTNRPSVISIIGATGTGKSQLAVELALALNGEIINADAMQMYRGLPIVTNKITAEEQKGVPHHLLGFLDSRDVWTVDKFVKEAQKTVAEIHSRNRLPILVGGTIYYVRSLLYPSTTLSTDPSSSALSPHVTDDELNLKYPILASDVATLYAELTRVDPLMASRWHPNDIRKIRRSLVIYYTTGQPPSLIYSAQHNSHQTDPTASASPYNNLIFWVHANSEVLPARLDARVDKMLAGGMWDEIAEMKAIHDKTAEEGELVDMQKGIWQSIGFKEFMAREETEEGRAEAVREMKTATRAYAKYQLSYIKKKLLPAVRSSGEEGEEEKKLFVFDSSEVERYDEVVVKPAVAIAEKWVRGEELPDPSGVSELAAEVLVKDMGEDMSKRMDLWKANKCEACGLTFSLEPEWQKHINSRRHKNRISSLKKKEQAQYFIDLKKKKAEEEKGRQEEEEGSERLEEMKTTIREDNSQS